MEKILVIDDNNEIRLLLSALLTRRGYDVQTLENGKDIVTGQVKGQDFDLIITDIFMPECEGVETIRSLRSTAPNTPIIAMSGGQTPLTQQHLKVAGLVGATASLTKPIKPQDLYQCIHDIFTLRAGQTSKAQTQP